MLSPSEQLGRAGCVAAPTARPLGEVGHGHRVGALAAAAARRLGTVDARLAYQAGLYHDVGKAMLPIDPRVLRRALTTEERRVVQLHPVFGAVALARAGAHPLVVAGALFHHERVDGTGYPYGLTGRAIPLIAQIVGAVDVYDALHSARSYKSAWPRREILAYGRDHEGRWFSPGVWAAVVREAENPRSSRRSPCRHPGRQAVTVSPPAGPIRFQSPAKEPVTSASSEPSVVNARHLIVR